jgi:hypothetical protein
MEGKDQIVLDIFTVLLKPLFFLFFFNHTILWVHVLIFNMGSILRILTLVSADLDSSHLLRCCSIKKISPIQCIMASQMPCFMPSLTRHSFQKDRFSNSNIWQTNKVVLTLITILENICSSGC